MFTFRVEMDGKAQTVQASSEMEIVRKITKPYLGTFFNEMYHGNPTFPKEMRRINRHPWVSVDDDDHEDHPLMTKHGIDYINLSVQKLEEMINSCQDKQQLLDKLDAALSDGAMLNIFYFLYTPGQGIQQGSKERHYCIIRKWSDKI